MPGGRVLVVEDEPMVAEVLETYLRRDGFLVTIAGTGPEALRAVAEFTPDLIVLDVMLPGLDGFEVCRRVRAVAKTPILILSARRHEEDRLHGLGIGADDYVTKPFSPREVVARAQAILRRAAPSQDAAPIQLGELAIDPTARVVTVAGEPRGFTAREFDLLWFLGQHPRQVFSREQLLAGVWGEDFEGEEDTVTVHIRRVRSKIEPDPSTPRYIHTVWGVGYKLEP